MKVSYTSRNRLNNLKLAKDYLECQGAVFLQNGQILVIDGYNLCRRPKNHDDWMLVAVGFNDVYHYLHRNAKTIRMVYVR